MDFFNAEVKKYEKKYKKRTKSGKSKDATTVQFSIPLNKDNPFQEENFVYILTENQIKDLNDELDVYEKANLNDKSDSNKLKTARRGSRFSNSSLYLLKTEITFDFE